ncbi:MAG: energy-coupling factor ABC transporter substrate-binding protein [Elainella sp. Prado103]|nr:energy-coupling factor ABC transporter substrate-binding protein [Elainella sp. Prado103]
MNRSTHGKHGNRWHNGLLGLGVIALTIAPLIFLREAEFQGSDGEAAAAIQEVQPTYRPWFQPIVEPASGEIESLLFALQAALGAGTIGYVIGLSRGRHTHQQHLSQAEAAPLAAETTPKISVHLPPHGDDPDDPG